MNENYQKIENQARIWIGTSFFHQGRLKKAGDKPKDFKGAVDCIGLLVGIARDLNIKSTIKDSAGNEIPIYKFDETNYSREPNGQRLKYYFDQFLEPLPENTELVPGQILLMKFAKYPQHCGIVGNYEHDGLSLIHAYQPVGKVCEHQLSDKWKKRIVGVYQFYGKSF